MEFRFARLSATFAALIAIGAGVVIAAPTQAAETRTISGTVTVPSDLGTEWKQRISVGVQSTTTGGTVGYTYANPTTGAYSVGNLPPGSYRVSFSVSGYRDSNGVIQFSDVIPESYNNVKRTTNGATPVDVTTENKSNINATLEYGHSVKGKITVPAGTPAGWYKGVQVEAFNNGVDGVSGWVNPDGTYAIRGLIPGSYTLHALVLPYWNDAGTATVPVPLVSEYWSNVRSVNDATYVPVTGNVTGKNFALERALTLSGTVTVPAGTPAEWLKSVTVRVSDGGDNRGFATIDPATGSYTVKDLPPATYTVEFSANSQYYDSTSATWKPSDLLSEFYSNATTQSGATKVTLSTANRTGVNAQLGVGGAIAGTVTLPTGAPAKWLKGVIVYAHAASGAQVSGSIDATTGTYRIGRLPAGAYKVQFQVASLVQSGGDSFTPMIASEYYNNVRSAAEATSISVSAGTVRSGINAAMEPIIEDSPKPTVAWHNGKAGLKANVPAWTPAPTSMALQWLKDGVAIPGATSETYVLTDSDRGHLFAVRATGSLSGYADTARTSSQYTIPLLAFTSTPAPTATGTLRSGYTLTAKPGTWSPTASFKYQWKRAGVAISGATKSTYKLTTADRGKKITVTVTGSRTGYTSVAKTSSSRTVYYEFTKTATPTITGTLAAGKTLTAKAGTWSPTPSFAYQWYRNGVAISGATKNTYKLTTADKGKKVTVKLTGKKAGYWSTSKTSAAKTIAK